MTTRSVFFTLITAMVCVPTMANAMASAELYSTKPYFYGRFEARIRFAPGDGVVSSFFLWKEGSEATDTFWNELDIEKVGANCTLQSNAYYGKPQAVHEKKHSVSGDLCGEYHDYSFEWTSSYIAWFVDGKEIRRETGATASAYAQNATAGMTMHFNVWPGNADFGGNIKNTKLPVHQYISWVQYSSYDNGNFKLQWREEFQLSGLPPDWGAGDWTSPYNQSTHNTKNVSFANGIATLSLTEDSATGNPGTPPADPTAVSTGGATATGGNTATGGSTATGGAVSTGGGASTGGAAPTGGSSGTGGGSASGGVGASGGATASGGVASGGATASGGAGTGGATGGSGGTTATGGTSQGGSATGGMMGSGGAGSTGGAVATGGAVSGGTATGGSESGGGTTGPSASDGGCSCNTGKGGSPLVAGLWVLFLLALRFRRKEV